MLNTKKVTSVIYNIVFLTFFIAHVLDSIFPVSPPRIDKMNELKLLIKHCLSLYLSEIDK